MLTKEKSENKIFVPTRIFFEQDAIKYPIGKKILDEFKDKDVEIRYIASHNKVTGIPGDTPQDMYREAKRTLVVGIRRTKRFQSCKPSAHYQLPLVTSCAGMCEYCYLNTTLGNKPYVRIYVNIDEILDTAQKYIEERMPDVTIFEGAATSDPIPVERYTGLLKRTIEFFGSQDNAFFRFVTKYTDIDILLDAGHNGHTTFRFSINTERIIKKYEHKTSSMVDRINASKKVAEADYKTGFIIGPIMYYENWEKEYGDMLEMLRDKLKENIKKVYSFELITHRYTERAKNNIMKIYPNTELVDQMNGKNRMFKYGQFGYGKYIYQKELMAQMKDFFTKKIQDMFPKSKIEYFV